MELGFQHKEPEYYYYSTLLNMLSPSFLNASPEISKKIKTLPSDVIRYLSNHVVYYSWINHLCLALIACDPGFDTPLYMVLIKVHIILRNAIPLIFPSLTSFDPEDAIIRLNRDFGLNYSHYCSEYSRLQDYTSIFLDTLPQKEKNALVEFLLPKLNFTKRLNDLLQTTKRQGRKEQETMTEPVKINLASLLQLSCIRKKWIQELIELVEKVNSEVKSGFSEYPRDVSIKSLNDSNDVKFRVWDKKSWIIHHVNSYSEYGVYKRVLCSDNENRIFLQLIGNNLEGSWFLKAIDAGALQTGYMNKRRDKEYIATNNLSTTLVNCGHAGILTPDKSTEELLMWVRKRASGEENDTKVIFDLYSLYIAAIIGNLALQSIGFTGIRMSELQQLSLDKDCIKIENIPVYNDNSSKWETDQYYTWNFYVKDRDTKVRVFVYRSLMNYVKEFKEIHKKFHNGNSQREILCKKHGFTLHRLFPEPKKYVFQWGEKQISAININACMEFILLEHGLTTINNEVIRISAKALRHGFAGYLHRQGVPIEYIQQLLHHVYYKVSEHYAKPTNEDINQKINPLINHLGSLLAIDQRSIKTEEDLKIFAEEVIKKFGAFRRVCGGRCGGIHPCDVLSSCPECSEFRPDPSRRIEIEEVINSLKRSKRFFEEKKQTIQVRYFTSIINNWELILKEVDSWKTILGLDFSNESLYDILPPADFGAGDATLVYSELKRLCDGLTNK